MRILIVHENVQTCNALQKLLQSQRYEVDAVFSQEDGYHYSRSGLYDIILHQHGVVLNVSLPCIELDNTIIPDQLLQTVHNMLHKSLPHHIAFGNITLDTKLHSLVQHDVWIQLTKIEFDMMILFINNIETILSKSSIANEIWDNPDASNNVEVYISHLRKKLKKSSSKHQIKTIRNKGYILTTLS